MGTGCTALGKLSGNAGPVPSFPLSFPNFADAVTNVYITLTRRFSEVGVGVMELVIEDVLSFPAPAKPRKMKRFLSWSPSPHACICPSLWVSWRP
jgi:hypothetical protein